MIFGLPLWLTFLDFTQPQEISGDAFELAMLDVYLKQQRRCWCSKGLTAEKKSVLTLWLGDFRIQFEYPNIVQSILTRTQRFIATSVDHYHYHDSAIRVGKLGRHVNNKNTCFFCPHVSVSYQFSPCNTLHWFCTASAAHAFEESLQLQLAKHQVWVTELLFVWRMSRDACSTLQLCNSGMISRTPYDKIVRNARRCRGAYFENTMWLAF